MDFHFTPEQEAFRREIRKFLDQHVTPEIHAEYDDNHTPGPLSKALLRQIAAQGWLGVGWPKEYGGQGRSMIEQLAFYEELDREHVYYGDLTITSLAMALIRIGSEAQKKEYLPRILRGELSICLGYTEPGAGSDLASLKTRAVRDGDVYVVNGQKVYTTGAHYSSHIWLLARTDPQATKHKGVSLFLFPLDTPGITVRPLYTMEGIRTNEVFFEDVRVPAACMVGKENTGFYGAAVALDYERVFMGRPHGARRALDQLIGFCKTFVVDGQPLFEQPIVQDRLVRFHIDVERLRLLNFRVAWMIEKGLVPTAEASAQKVLASELTQRITDEALQLMGPYGQLRRESPHAPAHGALQQAWLLSIMQRFGGGTNEIQRDIIAQRGLGLPRR
ncbi:MAG: acyl-CoA dehydrogenase family protein [Candidatus Binatia bacterium]